MIGFMRDRGRQIATCAERERIRTNRDRVREERSSGGHSAVRRGSIELVVRRFHLIDDLIEIIFGAIAFQAILTVATLLQRLLGLI